MAQKWLVIGLGFMLIGFMGACTSEESLCEAVVSARFSREAENCSAQAEEDAVRCLARATANRDYNQCFCGGDRVKCCQQTVEAALRRRIDACYVAAPSIPSADADLAENGESDDTSSADGVEVNGRTEYPPDTAETLRCRQEAEALATAEARACTEGGAESPFDSWTD